MPTKLVSQTGTLVDFSAGGVTAVRIKGVTVNPSAGVADLDTALPLDADSATEVSVTSATHTADISSLFAVHRIVMSSITTLLLTLPSLPPAGVTPRRIIAWNNNPVNSITITLAGSVGSSALLLPNGTAAASIVVPAQTGVVFRCESSRRINWGVEAVPFS